LKRLGFFGTAILLQVLILLVPGQYGWANVGGLFVFSLAYCFHIWLEYCKDNTDKSTSKRLEVLEKEARDMNAALQWRNK